LTLKAFAYPKTQHRRGPDPGPYTSYKTYKRHLRDEFQGTCVYCRVRDSVDREALFAVEHYRPQSVFPYLITEWNNLFYACLSCNGAKSNFVARGVLAKTRFIPNPCDHVMFAHLRYKGAVVEAHSKTGEFVIDQLDLNAPTSLQFREFFDDALANARQKLRACVDLVQDIEAATGRAAGARLAELQVALDEAKAIATEAEQKFRFIAGPYESLPA
jgi:hypothetical protein